MTIEAILSDVIVGTGEESIPERARVAAVRQLFDCVGVTLAATAEPAGRILIELAAAAGGTPESRILGTSIRSSSGQAAWTNGSLAHLLDFDDTGFSHPTACILPAVLATGEAVGASGHEVVTALILGYEVFERLAATARANEPELRRRGIHPTSVWGCPAAAAAAGRLLGLDRDAMTIALGIASSSASGLTQQFGSWSKGLNAGNAARAGVTAALLARAGYRGDAEGIGGRYGLLGSVVGHDTVDLSGFETDLGSRWSIDDPGISIKPYPACTSTLRAVDAMLEIAGRPGYDPGAVVRIDVDVHPDLLHTLRFRAPKDGFSGKFSLDYTVASAALDRGLTLESFSDQAAARPELRAMLGRVELRLHPEWPIARRAETPVTVALADGRVHEAVVAAHRGTRARPLSEDEIDAKYIACASRALTAEDAERSVTIVRGVDAAASISDVLDALVPTESAR